LAWRYGRAGFTFTRLSRALPLPVQGEREALESARRVAVDCHPTSDSTLGALRAFILAEARVGFRTPSVLPSSSSSCFEWPATRGGVDGYLRRQALLAALGLDMMGGNPVRLVSKRFGKWTQDSLGTFCLQKIREWALSGGEFFSSADDHVLRCLGVLCLRESRSATRTKACALKAPGMKFRVIGVPNALTFIEGTWSRWSASLLPRKHFVPNGGHFPSNLKDVPLGGTFHSLDLSKATDGLSHQVVEVVIRSLAEAGALRSSELEHSLIGLGVGGYPTMWSAPGVKDWIARRGSPMGTPLSFVVLSWINAFATEAFTASVTHGDDAVGYALDPQQIEDYRAVIADMGASVNLTKTFRSQRCFTLCERFYVLRGTTERSPVAFCPPPCPPPGSREPQVASGDQWPLYLRRAERVQKALFPWCSRSPSLRLPTCVGGYGYTGRGLKVSRAVRVRLSAACSRNVPELALEVLERQDFREEGLFPRPLVPRPRDAAGYHRFRKGLLADSSFSVGPATGSESDVPFRDFVAWREGEVLRTYLSRGGAVRRVGAGGRPERTKRRALFRKSDLPHCRPLSVAGGVGSLERLAARLDAQRVSVRPDVASIIRGRTTEER
jgi:hypothetical protein